jgi:HEAT repeat protein
MKKSMLLLSLLLLSTGCGPTNRPGGEGTEAIMEGKPASYWVQQLKNSDPQIRATAIGLLVKHGKEDNSVWNEIMGALKGNDPELQVGACEVFGQMGLDGRDAFEVLKSKLNDPNTRVNMAVGIAMAKIDADEAAKAGIPRSILKQKH